MTRRTDTLETGYSISEWDDPVPENSHWNWDFPECSPHEVEGQIRSALLARPDMQFTSLVVRRTENGVCLQGVMQVGDDFPDVASVVRQMTGIENVLNQLLFQSVEASAVT